MKHPLADLFDGSADVLAEIETRVPDTTDHVAETARAVDAHHPRRLTLTVTEVIEETPSTRTFRLRRPSGGELPPFLAGQYVAVIVDGTNRPYAISSSPHRLDHYDLTIRRVPGGRISNLLVDTLKPGDTLVTSGPMGTFHHNPLFHGDRVVFLAGGSGVVPAMSMIRAIAGGDPVIDLHLVYGSRSADDVLFKEELAAVPPNVKVDHVIGDLLTADRIAALTGPLDGRMVYVCGPQAMYPFALDELTALGHPRRRIRFEANGAPNDPAGQPHWPAADPGGRVTVTARGRTFTTPRGRPLLDALEDNGIPVESACRSGECGLCRLRVRQGTVHHAEEARLRMSDAGFGYVHSCVAYPITDLDLDV